MNGWGLVHPLHPGGSYQGPDFGMDLAHHPAREALVTAGPYGAAGASCRELGG